MRSAQSNYLNGCPERIKNHQSSCFIVARLTVSGCRSCFLVSINEIRHVYYFSFRMSIFVLGMRLSKLTMPTQQLIDLTKHRYLDHPTPSCICLVCLAARVAAGGVGSAATLHWPAAFPIMLAHPNFQLLQGKPQLCTDLHSSLGPLLETTGRVSGSGQVRTAIRRLILTLMTLLPLQETSFIPSILSNPFHDPLYTYKPKCQPTLPSSQGLARPKRRCSRPPQITTPSEIPRRETIRKNRMRA